jgi:hypothetical protein
MAQLPKPPWTDYTQEGEGVSVKVGREKQPEYGTPTGFNYTPSPSCGLDTHNKLSAGRCFVNLTFKDGKTMLRFCDEAKDPEKPGPGPPGKLVPVDSPEHALAVAREACARFAETGDYGLPEGLELGSGSGVKLVTGKLTLGKLPGLSGLPAGGVAGMKKKSRAGIGALPTWAKCRHVGPLDAAKKKKLPKSAFGIPEKRAYPMPDPKHAANAKGRAKAQLNKGKLSQKDYNRIVRKANRVIGACKRK